MGPTPIQSVSTNASGSIGAVGSGTGGTPLPTGTGTSDVATSTGSMSMSMSSNVVTVQSRVDQFVGSFGSEMGSDQNLRMMIALIILNALLGKNDDQQLNRATEAAGLSALLDSFSRRAPVATFSATNIIQMQSQSTLVMTSQAVQSITESGDGSQGSPGTQLDVSG